MSKYHLNYQTKPAPQLYVISKSRQGAGDLTVFYCSPAFFPLPLTKGLVFIKV